MLKVKSILLVLTLLCGVLSEANSAVLDGVKLTKNDAVLVVEGNGDTVFSWQATKPLVPASLIKLATAYLAIDKWGLEHRFYTDFLIDGETLWVKGYGDPYLVSEELDSVVSALKQHLSVSKAAQIKQINIDNSYFDISFVPGRSAVADPYNAPISAVSANFNTAKLSRKNGRIESAEAQTPLTKTAKKRAHTLTKPVDRVNLFNAANAQSNFAELLVAKLGWTHVAINIGESLVDTAQLLYRHENSHTLADVLRGTLEFSNNFMANQVFLNLAGGASVNSVSFVSGRDYSNKMLSNMFGWRDHSINEGSGLSRKNRLSAKQIEDLLNVLEPNKSLFKKIDVQSTSALVRAKTGTLDGVRSYAGYIEFPPKSSGAGVKNYRFVFNFNRAVPYRYRDQVLEELLADLARY